MTYIEIAEYLCNSDPRNPMYEYLYSGLDEEDKPKPSPDCYCDNCFYGKTKLANELLKYVKE